jgi:archaellum biogenesis ATPase FlaH
MQHKLKPSDEQIKEQCLKFSDEQVEQLIVRQFFWNSDYTHLILENFDDRIFQTDTVKYILKTGIAYFEKYDRLPERTIIDMCFKRYASLPDSKLSYENLIGDFNKCMDMNIDDTKFVKDAVLGFIRNKSMYYAIYDNLKEIEDKKDVSSCIAKFHKIDGIALDIDPEFDYFRDLDKHMEELTRHESMISTGYSELDRRMNGGLPKEGQYLMVVMARTGLGKSLLMSNMAVNFMKQNLFPFIISLEMPEKRYGHRIDAHISKMDINSIPRNTDIAIKKIHDFEELYPRSKLVIKDFPPKSINCRFIERYIKKYMRLNRKPDVLIVDYLTLLNPNSHSKTERSDEKIGNIAVELRKLSYTFEMPVIAPIQLNRGGYNNNNADVDNISESLIVAYTTDFIGNMWQQDGDREAGIMNFSILKQRNGITGKPLKFNINYSNLTISDSVQKKETENIAKEKGAELIKDINAL